MNMKKLLVLMVGLCLIAGTAVAKEAHKQDVKMMEDSQGLFDDIRAGSFGVAQAGTTWIGWRPGGVIGAPGVWDFDDRGLRNCPTEDDYHEYIKNGAYAQDWTSEDVYAQTGIYWHIDDFTDPSLACSSGPIAGTYSAWCGKITPDPGECFNDPPGYGHNWNQWMCKSVTMDPVTPRLRYKFRSDTEPGFDYGYVFIDGEFPDSCGWIGDDGDTLRCYDGPHGNTNEDIDLTMWTADPDVCDDVPADPDYSGDSVKVCFVVISDGGWDDQDGTYPTCDGAMTVDNIFIDTAHSSGDSVYSDFEPPDSTIAQEGWETCGGFSPGDYVAIRHRSSFINNDPCQFTNCDMEQCVLTYWNPNIAGQFGNGGHYAGDFHKRAWSPTIDMTGYPTRGYVIACDRYVDLPIPNWIFYRYYVSYVQDVGCPTGAWSPAVSDNYVYYASPAQCNYREWGFSQFVPTDADSVKIGLSAWNGCNVWEVPCTNGNESPVFDNVMLGIWDLSAPQASIRAVDNFTDSWPEDDTLVLPQQLIDQKPLPDCDEDAVHNTARIDAANNKSQTGAFLRMADSCVISLAAPDVYAELCFRVRPGPCTDNNDPWWNAVGLCAVNCVLTEQTACVRMDTAFAAGDGDTASAYEYQVVFENSYVSLVHEDDPAYPGYEGMEIFPDSLFTAGTEIYYYFRTAYVGSGPPFAYLPATADPDDIATWYEVEVLPDRCYLPECLACLLYVDYYNRGAQQPIEAALTALGRTWDRMDLRAESSHQGNGIGNRLLGAGRYRLVTGPIGPSNDHLAQYNVMLINSGHFDPGTCYSDGGTGTPDDPTNDIGFLDQWINEGRDKGLWINGDGVASDFATATSGPKPDFLNLTLSASLVASSYRELSGHDIFESCRMLTSEWGWADFEDSFFACGEWWEYANYVYLLGSGCPDRYDFDVLDYGAGAGITYYMHIYDRTDLVGNPPGGWAASIHHRFPAANAPFDTVLTLIDGYSLHSLRVGKECGNYPGLDYQVGIALMLKDRLGDDMGHPCVFYDTDLCVQKCPPKYPDTTIPYTGIDGRGPKTYANALFQNYPNPFRSVSGTTIHYSVAKAGDVEVRIFDVAGRLVNTLVDKAALGENFVVWDGKTSDGRSVASGVYFYQIKTDAFSAQKKMMLVN